MGVWKLTYQKRYITGHPPQYTEEKIWLTTFVGRNYLIVKSSLICVLSVFGRFAASKYVSGSSSYFPSHYIIPNIFVKITLSYGRRPL